jgi:hypothetical protein
VIQFFAHFLASRPLPQFRPNFARNERIKDWATVVFVVGCIAMVIWSAA